MTHQPNNQFNTYKEGLDLEFLREYCIEHGEVRTFLRGETLYACNTYQFSDYSRYAMTIFKEEDKRKHHDEHFPQYLKNAYDLGRRLVSQCQEA